MVRTRSEALKRNGDVALTSSGALMLFLAAAGSGTDQWTPLHTWLLVAIAGTGTPALLCYWLAGRVSHPPVSHPPVTSPSHPHEVRK